MKARKQPANKNKSNENPYNAGLPTLDDDKDKFDRSGFKRRMADGRVVNVKPTRAKRPGQ